MKKSNWHSRIFSVFSIMSPGGYLPAVIEICKEVQAPTGGEVPSSQKRAIFPMTACQRALWERAGTEKRRGFYSDDFYLFFPRGHWNGRKTTAFSQIIWVKYQKTMWWNYKFWAKFTISILDFWAFMCYKLIWRWRGLNIVTADYKHKQVLCGVFAPHNICLPERAPAF